MHLKKIENQYYINYRRYVMAELGADSEPSTLPMTGQNIKGLNADDYLAPGSTILTISGKLSILGENAWGDWLE